MVRNTKAKVRRTIKNYGIDLSNKIDVPDIESFSTRKEFNEWKNKQSSFTNRANLHYQFKKNQYDVVATKKEIIDVERNTKKAQEIADKYINEAKDKPYFVGGKREGTVGQQMMQMGKPNAGGITRPKDFDFSKVKTRKDLEVKFESMEKRAYPEYYDWRKEQMKMNFMKMLEKSFNSDADELIDELANIPPDDFYEIYLMFGEFEFTYYPVEGVDDGGKLNDVNKMLSYLERYREGKIDLDMKNY